MKHVLIAAGVLALVVLVYCPDSSPGTCALGGVMVGGMLATGLELPGWFRDAVEETGAD